MDSQNYSTVHLSILVCVPIFSFDLRICLKLLLHRLKIMKEAADYWHCRQEHDDKEKVIEKSETSSSINSDDLIKPSQGFREQLAHLIHSRKAQILVVVLVLLDCVCVLGELLIDLKVFEDEAKVNLNNTHPKNDAHKETSHESAAAVEEEEKASIIAAEVLHYFSIAILSIFLVELGIKLFAMGKSFFKHKMEVVDAVIIIVSFALDIAFIGKEGLSSGLGLLVVFRLWRFGRIFNGMSLPTEKPWEESR